MGGPENDFVAAVDLAQPPGDGGNLDWLGKWLRLSSGPPKFARVAELADAPA